MPKMLFPTELPELEWVEFQAAGFSQPVCGVVYSPDKLKPVCGVPLGGIGTGCLDVGVDGRLGFCTIFERIWGHDYRDRVVADHTDVDLPSTGRGPLNMPFLGLSASGNTWVLTTWPVAGVEKAKRIHYWGHYPVADLEYDIDAPVRVGLRAWAPFLPGDIKNSSIPGAVFEVHLRNPGNSEQRGVITFSFPGPKGDGIPFKRRRVRGRFNGVEVIAPEASYVLGAVGEESVRLGGALGTDGRAWAKIADRLPRTTRGNPGASAAVDFVLPAGQQKTIRFLLTWCSSTWKSDFPYGCELHEYTNRYTQEYPSALETARKLARDHASLLEKVLAWQEIIYTEQDLPLWLRDQLVNILHLITEDSFWAVAEPPLGDWCFQGGLFSLCESTVADGQQSLPACDWFGNFPIVYFFPDLARSTLRAYREKMREDGAVPFRLGRGLDLVGGPDETDYAYERQRTLNGCCYADLVDRLWLRTGNDEILQEFYPSVKQNTIYTINQNPGPEGIIGLITTLGDEWYESMDMRGITAHAGGARLAQLKISERMAEQMGDHAFAQQCREWFAQGTQVLEERLWDGECYLLSLDPATGKKNDLVLAYQLDGEWIARLHGLPGVFRPGRVSKTLDTIKRLNAAVPRGGAINVIQRDGRFTQFGWRMAWTSSMPASVLILAMTYLYAGQRERGLDLAYECMDNLVNKLGMTWDMPNIVRADPGAGELPECMRIYGTDYYQVCSLWAFPAVMKGEDLRGPVAVGGLVDRVLEAGKGE